MAQNDKESVPVKSEVDHGGMFDSDSAAACHGVRPLPKSGTIQRSLEEQDLVRKLDRRVLPTIFVVFVMNFMDVGFSPSAVNPRIY